MEYRQERTKYKQGKGFLKVKKHKVCAAMELIRLAEHTYTQDPKLKMALRVVAVCLNEHQQCSLAQLAEGEEAIVELVHDDKWTKLTSCQMITYFNGCK